MARWSLLRTSWTFLPFIFVSTRVARRRSQAWQTRHGQHMHASTACGSFSASPQFWPAWLPPPSEYSSQSQGSLQRWNQQRFSGDGREKLWKWTWWPLQCCVLSQQTETFKLGEEDLSVGSGERHHENYDQYLPPWSEVFGFSGFWAEFQQNSKLNPEHRPNFCFKTSAVTWFPQWFRKKLHPPGFPQTALWSSSHHIC